MAEQSSERHPADLALARAEKALELASAFLTVQVATIKGLAAQGVVNEGTLRDYLIALLNDLRPEEREVGFGSCLAMLVAALEATPTGTPTRPN